MSAHFISTRPHVELHRQCGRPILVGIAEGIRVRVDPAPLPIDLQLLAVLRRVRLFWLDQVGLAEITAARAGHRRRHPVLPEHWCGYSWPTPVFEATAAHDHPPY